MQFLDWMSIYLFLIGLCMGSFLNVVILRLPESKSLIKPKSHCPKCKKSLQWFHNIPVLGFLFLRGKCAYCDQKISPQYPLVEMLTGVLFVLVFRKNFMSDHFSVVLLCRDLIFISMFIAMAFIDLKHRILPDVITLPGLVLALLFSFFDPELGVMLSLFGAGLGFIFFYGLSYFYFKLKNTVGLGGGDIKLIAFLGAFLGPLGVLYTILLSSVLGSVLGILFAVLFQKKEKSELMGFSIPYGPFLLVGSLLYYFLGDFLWLLSTTQI